MLLVLLYLAKKGRFASDRVYFNTTDICRGLHRSPKKELRDRIEESLTRLKALTIKYELTWYDKEKAEVEQKRTEKDTGVTTKFDLVKT